MAFDFKKEYKEFYMPKNKPGIVTVPSMNYIAVRGQGDPNQEDGEYKQSIGLLYGIAFTIKMSKMGDRRIDGYFDYVVPPLEGFWWQDGVQGIDYAHKDAFQWISVIRLPDFVTADDFAWAVGEATRKKKTDFSKAEFLTYDEGLCVQCMHIGSYDKKGFAGKAEDGDSAPDPKGITAGQIRAGNDRTISAMRDTMIPSRDGGSADGVAYQYSYSDRVYGRASDRRHQCAGCG